MTTLVEAGALSALADRVEREAPSDELDAAIQWAVRGTRVLPGPYYTSSIDAAVTLTDEYWHLENGDPAIASVFTAKPDKEHFGHGATPAAALVVASLRARAAMMEKADG